MTTESMMGMDRWEKILAKYSASLVFAGSPEFVAKALNQVKKARTQTQQMRSEKAEAMSSHYDLLLSASEVRLNVMVEKEVSETFVNVQTLEDHKSLKPRGLPKRNFMEWGFRHALECMPPRCVTFEWKYFWTIVDLIKTGPKPDPNCKRPLIFCTKFDDDDLEKGLCVTGLCWFIETYIYKPMIEDTTREAAACMVRIAECATEVITHLDAYPKDKFDSPAFKRFLSKSRGLVLLFGKVPFACGSSIGDIEVLKNDKDSCLPQSIHKTHWASARFGSAFIRNAGEVEAFPAIKDAAPGKLPLSSCTVWGSAESPPEGTW